MFLDVLLSKSMKVRVIYQPTEGRYYVQYRWFGFWRYFGYWDGGYMSDDYWKRYNFLTFEDATGFIVNKQKAAAAS